MQALNELRREGIKELTEKIQMQYRREEADCETETKKTVEKNSTGKECSISASVQSKAQLEAAVNSGVRCVYLDEEIEFERENGVQYFLAMPYIFRERTIRRYERMYAKIEEKYDGILIRNWESYAWLRQHAYQKEIRSDYNLYIFNQKAKEELKDLGIGQGTAPVELNDRELAELGIEEQAFIAYGYQPVMVSAGCIKKTSASCDGKGGVLTISDRYQKEFTVRCYCRDCYNVMYNSAPLFLADKAEEIRKLMPAQIRLDFTVENKEQVREICKIYMNAFTEGKKMEPQIREYTRGHLKEEYSRWKLVNIIGTVIKISDDTDDHSVYVSGVSVSSDIMIRIKRNVVSGSRMWLMFVMASDGISCDVSGKKKIQRFCIVSDAGDASWRNDPVV